jgi:hypothetical protein
MTRRKEPTEAEIQDNLGLCEYYPLGHVDVMWTLLEGLYGQTVNKKERKGIGKVMTALEEYDNIMRANRFQPWRKK